MAFDVEDEIVAVIPANGFFVHWVDLESGELFGRDPVIGFVVTKRQTLDGESYNLSCSPVTAVDVFDGENEYVIERPDGRIEIPASATVASLDEAKARFKAAAEKRKARREAGHA